MTADQVINNPDRDYATHRSLDALSRDLLSRVGPLWASALPVLPHWSPYRVTDQQFNQRRPYATAELIAAVEAFDDFIVETDYVGMDLDEFKAVEHRRDALVLAVSEAFFDATRDINGSGKGVIVGPDAQMHKSCGLPIPYPGCLGWHSAELGHMRRRQILDRLGRPHDGHCDHTAEALQYYQRHARDYNWRNRPR